MQGPLGAAAIFDPQTNSLTPVAQPLLQPRAWHTATVLADGGVLIAGGLDRWPGVTVIEHFDPTMQAFHLVPATGLVPRADQTATLLTDGRVLFAGGVSAQGQVLATPSSSIRDVCGRRRSSHSWGTARGDGQLLPDGACSSGAERMQRRRAHRGRCLRSSTGRVHAGPVAPMPDPSDQPPARSLCPGDRQRGSAYGQPGDASLLEAAPVDQRRRRPSRSAEPSGPEAATVVVAEGGGTCLCDAACAA